MSSEAEKAVLGKKGYNDVFFYQIDVKDQEITPILKEVISKIKALEKEKKELVDKLVNKAERPNGWGVDLREVYDYGYIEVDIVKRVHRKPPEPTPVEPKPIIPPVEPTALERLTRLLDIKTLFNSGILTKEEKRELLGLNFNKDTKHGN